MSRLLTVQFECPRTWESMAGTGDVRWCDECGRSVIACSTIGEAKQRARRAECIAVPSDFVATSSDQPRSRGVTVCGSFGGDSFPHVAWLVPLDGPRTGETLKIELSETGSTIGREQPADIIIPDPEVAPIHARIVFSKEGLSVVDAGSPTGTLVNDRRTSRAELRDNDIIQIGGTRLLFKSVS